MSTMALRTVATVTAAVLIAGCSASSTPGKAVKANDADAPVVALMDAGAYKTTPGHPFGVVGDDKLGQSLLEAHRMSEFTVGPWEVDDALRMLPGAIDAGTSAPMSSAKDMRDNQILPSPWPDVAEAYGFLTGFSSTRISAPQAGQPRGLQNVVMRFPDATAAAAAAAEMVAKAPPLRDIVPSPPAPVAGTPESLALTYALPDDITRMDSFTAHGPYVLYQSARTATAFIGKSAAVLVDSALTLQKKRIDEFTPTDPSALPTLPLDPTGRLLAQTLTSPDNAVPIMAGVWPPQGWLHFETDPVAAAALFNTTGVDAVTQRLTTVYQAGNADGAARIAAEFTREMSQLQNVGPTDGVRGLPAARCFQRRVGGLPGSAPMTWQRVNWQFKCVATVDRYAYTAFSADAADVRQQMAAQYRILAGE